MKWVKEFRIMKGEIEKEYEATHKSQEVKDEDED